jgi:glycerol-3-phosphate dehydrogenase
LLLPEGGRAVLPRIRSICQPELGWDDARWESEEAAYREMWGTYYSIPDRAAVPDWRAMLEEANVRRAAARPTRKRKVIQGSAVAAGLAGLALLATFVYFRLRSDSRRRGQS